MRAEVPARHASSVQNCPVGEGSSGRNATAVGPQHRVGTVSKVFFRIRTRLADTPGTLARLATLCGESEVNILSLQIHLELGAVLDDLVVEAPDPWTADGVADLVARAGGEESTVTPCAPHDLVDPSTTWLRAALAVLDDPGALPAVVDRLAGPVAHRSGAEEARVRLLSEIAGRGWSIGVPPPAGASGAADLTWSVEGDDVLARVGRHLVGRGRVLDRAGGVLTVAVEVAPAWRRRGIGRGLLVRVREHAVATGAEELLLRGPAGDTALVHLVAAAGLGGRIRSGRNGLWVRITLPAAQPARGTVPAR